MSIRPIEPDNNRHCFRACFPGTFCKCLGKYIAEDEEDLSEFIKKEIIDDTNSADTV